MDPNFTRVLVRCTISGQNGVTRNRVLATPVTCTRAPRREVGSFDEPHRVIDSNPPATIDDRALEGECPADIDLCAPIEMELARSQSSASKHHPADRHRGDG